MEHRKFVYFWYRCKHCVISYNMYVFNWTVNDYTMIAYHKIDILWNDFTIILFNVTPQDPPPSIIMMLFSLINLDLPPYNSDVTILC